jgi:gas vesicle protein
MSKEERDEMQSAHEEGASGLAWFLTGAVIGATVAVLYTPKTGKQTRRFIVDKTQQGREVLEDTSKDIADAGREMFERGRKLVEDAADLFERGRKLVKG